MRPDLLKLTETAFREGGPVHRIVGQFRPLQQEGAEWFARSVSGASNLCNLNFGQIDTGVGKTLLYSVVLGFYVLETELAGEGKRGLISTYTTALRSDIAGLTDTLNKILEATYEELELPLPRQVSIAERKSATSYASRNRAQWLRRALPSLDEIDKEHVSSYLDWLDNDDTPELSTWMQHPDSGGMLPLQLSETDLCLTPGEIRGNSTAANAFNEARARAQNADIVVVTHAMLLKNNMSFGGNLGTTRWTEEERAERIAEGLDVRTFGACVVDEADQIPNMSRTVTDTMSSISFLKDLADQAHTDFGAVAKPLVETVQDLEAALRAFCPNIPSNIASENLSSSRINGPVMAAVDAVLEQLDLIQPLYRPRKNGPGRHDPRAYAHLQEAQNSLSSVRLVNKCGGSTAQEMMAIDWTDALAWAEFMPSGDIRFGLKPRRSQDAFNRLWAHRTIHAFDSITFMSATLKGKDDTWGTTFRKLGVQHSLAYKNASFTLRDEDSIDVENRCIMLPDPKNPAHRSVEFGKLSRIVQVAVPLDEKGPGWSPSLGRWETEWGFTNTRHLDLVADAIEFVARHKDGKPPCRTLVLFSAERSLDYVMKALAGRVPEERLFAQRSMQKITPERLRAFEAVEDGFWFGLNWEGMNLRSETTGETLVRRVILSKIPLMASDTVMDTEFGYFGFDTRLDEAHRRITQGIGRGIRQASDQIDLWIMDPRWPLHPEVINRLLQRGLPYGRSAAASTRRNAYSVMDTAIPFRLNKPMTRIDRRAFTEAGQLI